MLTPQDVEKIREAAPHYHKKGRDLIVDLHLIQIHERVEDVRYRPPNEERNWNRHYLEIDTGDVYYYSDDKSKRSKLGKFTIHLPLDEMSQASQGYPEAEIPSITGGKDEHGNKADHGSYLGHKQYAEWGGGLIMKGRFKGFLDHTGEGCGHESYHPHVYGGGVNLCLGSFHPNIHIYGDYDLPAFVETVFKFLREGGRNGDNGDFNVSMYSNCIKEIFSRNSEEVEVKKVTRTRKSKDALKSGLGIKKAKVAGGGTATKKAVKKTLTKNKATEKQLDQKLAALNSGSTNPHEVKDLLDGILELLD